jgi:FkbM family methyltransferase
VLSNFFRNATRAKEIYNCISRVESPVASTLAYTFRKKTGYPLSIELKSGPVVRVHNWDELTTVWHVWCADEYIIPDNAKTILDLGANIGAFALWASTQAPNSTIYSVEPFPETHASLKENIGSNKLENRVNCYQIAVADTDGEVWFDATEGKRSYCRKIVSDDIEAKKIKVPCLKLDTLLDHCGLHQVDCIKLDIEGGEHAMFAASSTETLRRSKIYTFEYHDAKQSLPIWEHLAKSGFERIGFKDNGWSGLATYRRLD